MSPVPIRIIALSTCALIGLAGCEEGSLVNEPRTTEDGGTVIREARTVMQEVERADIFQAKETALWDGRPSLGGMWVAHPDVRDPERVRITNTANGKVINGALFRRERMNPGPRIQVSSDAARALDMLAGQPSELEIIVLRQEEVVIEPAVVAAPEPEPAEDAEPPEAETEGTGDAEVAAVATGAVAVAAADTSAPPRRGFWQRFRDSLRNEPAAAPAAQETLEGAADVADSASAPTVETAPLGTIAVASAAIAAAEASETESAPPAPASPAPSGVKNPFIQIGLFGEQANASAAASSLRQAGIVPTVSEGRNANGPFWRILVGPVTTSADQSELLAQVRTLGYADAFLTDK